MAWPEEPADSVNYAERELISNSDLALRMVDGARLDLWGSLFVNGLPLFSDHVFDVTTYGAKGDGVSDDHEAIQATLNACSVSGGIVLFPPGKTYMSSGGLTYNFINSSVSNPILISAYSAHIKLKSGSNTTLFMFSKPGMNADIPPPFIKGGRYWDASGGTGNTCFLFRDTGVNMQDVIIREFSQGKAIYIQNWLGWSEQSRILNCGSSSCRHAIYFSDGVDSGGPSGTTSFARTQVWNMSLSRGEEGYGFIRATGNVYHSSFIGLWGNLGNVGSHIFQDDSVEGSFNGTRIHWSGFEGATVGSYFYYRPNGIWPSNLPDIYGNDQIGVNMSLTNLSDPAGNFLTSFNGRIRVAGYNGYLGAEWGIGIAGGKSIVSGHHPSGPNPSGTRMDWLSITTADELVIGGVNAGRTPVATLLGRMAPVKICAPTQQLGFFDVGPIARPTVTGSRGGNAALASLITALAQYGLIIDSSTE